MNTEEFRDSVIPVNIQSVFGDPAVRDMASGPAKEFLIRLSANMRADMGKDLPPPMLLVRHAISDDCP